MKHRGNDGGVGVGGRVEAGRPDLPASHSALIQSISSAKTPELPSASFAQLAMLPNDRINPLFHATVNATEEAIVNAMIAAETMTGINGNTVYALPHDRLVEILRRHHALTGPPRRRANAVAL